MRRGALIEDERFVVVAATFVLERKTVKRARMVRIGLNGAFVRTVTALPGLDLD